MFRSGAQRRRPFAGDRRTILFVALIGVELVVAALLFGASMRPAQAQFWGWGGGWDSPPRPRAPVGRARRQRDRGFSFPFFFQNERRRSVRPYGRSRPTETRRRRDVTRSEARAPAPRRPDATPGKTVLVLGDAMADWLGFGLEEAFAETNELGVVRKARPGSTLIRNDSRDFDWQQGVRDALASEKADFVVMMAGLADRHAIVERTQQRAATGQQNTGQTAPTEPERRSGALLHGFRSDKWGEVYGKRIDEIIAALQAKRVPVFWVGLPPVRGTKASEDIAFLNGIFKERAEKAGITFVDVWEGFVDEDGDFSQYGPDVMGQTRSLRSSDGVHFTRAGARKLAHFVDREIKRLLSRETPVALPIPDIQTAPVTLPGPTETPSGPAPRPIAGPVLPLTGGLAAAPPPAEPLLGARQQDGELTDPLAVKVLVKGEPPQTQPGRADHFTWPPAHAVAANDVAEPLEQPATTATVAAQPAKPVLRPLPRIGAPRPSSTRTAAQPARQVQ